VVTVFLGTSEFAAAVLERLAASEHRPSLVLTRPDRRSGRGQRLHAPPVADAARELGMELAQPDRVNDPASVELIARAQPSVVVVCAFGALIAEPLLHAHEMLNVHPSLLPRWRGAAPVERAIIAGDERTGVSIMRVTAGLDAGPVCAARDEPIRDEDTYGSLATRLREIGAELLLGVLDARARGEEVPFEDQDDGRATYAEKILAADRLLDPSRPAVELERVVRALEPHIGARATLADGTVLGVHRAALAGEASAPARGGESAPKGVFAQDGRLLLACTPGELELLRVTPPGARTMDAAEYLRGHGLPVAP
jgi:methionyl-tRNA formyltransferase